MWNIVFKTFKVLILYIFALFSVIIFDLVLDCFESGIIFKYRNVLRSSFLCILSFLCIYGTCFIFYSSRIIYKIIVLILLFIGLILLFFYFFNNSVWFSNFKSIDDLRRYISNFNNAPFIYILVQFLQVIMLPIPSIIVTGAGVMLFGPLKCGFYSCFGVILGSITSFLIGRKFGYKFVSWFFGQDLTDKWLTKIEGKSKIFLTFAFLFPFFPDDTLCALSGITKIRFSEFLTIVISTRITAIFISCFTLNNDLLPLNRWWGIMILIVIVAIIFIFSKKYLIKLNQ